MALATAAELFSGEVAHFFGNRINDNELLEALQDRYIKKEKEGPLS